MPTLEITEYKSKFETDAYTVYLFPDGSLLFRTEEVSIDFGDLNEATRWADRAGDKRLVSWLIAQSVFTG